MLPAWPVIIIIFIHYYHRRLNSGSPEFTEKVVELHPLLLCHPRQGIVVIILPPPAESGALFNDIVGVLPVIPFKTHLFGPLSDDPPVRLCLTRRIIELRIEPEPSFTIGTCKIRLSPCSYREDYVSVFGADGVTKIYILVDYHHTAAVGPLLQSVYNIFLEKTHHLMRVPAGQAVECIHLGLGSVHRGNPGRPNDPGEPDFPGLHPPVKISRMPS